MKHTVICRSVLLFGASLIIAGSSMIVGAQRDRSQAHGALVAPAATAAPSLELVSEPTFIPPTTLKFIIESMPASEPVRMCYDIPLNRDLQLFIIDLCEKHHIDPVIVLAMIATESRYQIDAIGDNGNAYGLMQIQARWHNERMERLGCRDLLDPYQNVTVGIDFFAELIAYYDGNVEMALVAYNAGQQGAYKNWFQRGVYSSKYSQKVLMISQDIMRGEDAQ